jgi:hypothetical protein
MIGSSSISNSRLLVAACLRNRVTHCKHRTGTADGNALGAEDRQ